MRRISVFHSVLLTTCACCASSALANAGAFIPLSSYSPGSDVPPALGPNLVQNGTFENVDGSGNPVGWTKVGSFRTDSPVGANIGASGAKAAQGPLNTTITNDEGAPNKYVQTVSVQPFSFYRLSGYMWNFSQNYDLTILEAVNTQVDLVDTVQVPGAGITLVNSDGGIDGGAGQYGYKIFNTGNRTSLMIEAEFDIDIQAVSGGPHTVPFVAGQLDNISLVLVPEPASLSMLGLGAVALLRRRKA